LVTEERFREKVYALARRMDLDPPEIRIIKKDVGDMSLRIKGRTLVVQSHTLNDLTESELDFALALGFSRYIHQRWWLFPIWVVPPALFGAVGYILHESQVEEYTRNFWLGFTVVFGCLALGYLVSEALYSWYTKLDRQNVFHEALVLTGNARSAESYLIRLQADMGSDHLRSKLSHKRKEQLEAHLQALEAACKKLGLSYQSVSNKLS
jgi:hypothetical protein